MQSLHRKDWHINQWRPWLAILLASSEVDLAKSLYFQMQTSILWKTSLTKWVLNVAKWSMQKLFHIRMVATSNTISM
jgi:hypothetical protein